jgi:Uma2 family endonuclease
LDVVEAVNLRLRQGRITIPDLVVTELPDLDTNVLDAEMIWLVCEITSPSNAATDRLLKMRYYATAGIEWYLVVEQDDLILRLHHLDNGRYVEHSVAKPGEPLQLPSPIDVQIDPADLLPPIRSSVTPLS